MKSSSHTFLLLVLTVVTIKECNGSPATKKLLDKLLSNYQLLERPVREDSEALRIEFGLTLMQIIGIWETDDIIKLSAWQTIKWVDANLVWDPKDFNNVSDIKIPPHRIFRPDILHYNGVGDAVDNTYQTNVFTLSNGSVTYIPPSMISSTCTWTYTNFPFDERICELKFGSWTYDGSQIDLVLHSEDGADLSSYIPHPQWELLGAPAVRNERYFACCKDPYIDVVFTLHLRRNGAHILSPVKRSNVLIFVSLFISFLIPVNSVHKITFAIIHVVNAWWPIYSFDSHYPYLTTRTTDGGGPLFKYCMAMAMFSLISLLANVVSVCIYNFAGDIPQGIRSKLGLTQYSNGTGDSQNVESKSEKIQQNLKDWKRIGILVDRCFFALFTTIGIIMFLGFYPATNI